MIHLQNLQMHMPCSSGASFVKINPKAKHEMVRTLYNLLF